MKMELGLLRIEMVEEIRKWRKTSMLKREILRTKPRWSSHVSELKRHETGEGLVSRNRGWMMLGKEEAVGGLHK